MNRIAISLAALAVTGCAHNVSASKKYAEAPRIENPLVNPSVMPVPGLTPGKEAFIVERFDGAQLCFTGDTTQAPVDARGSKYTLRGLDTDNVDLKNSPAQKISMVEVINSTSEQVPVTRTVEDKMRDSNGNIIATYSREVQELETRYQTQVRVCFTNINEALSPDSRFMVLLREEKVAKMWGIPMTQRPSWVWRFPKADQVETVAQR